MITSRKTLACASPLACAVWWPKKSFAQHDDCMGALKFDVVDLTRNAVKQFLSAIAMMSVNCALACIWRFPYWQPGPRGEITRQYSTEQLTREYPLDETKVRLVKRKSMQHQADPYAQR